MDVSCHRPFLPGTSLEPAVNPTAQASSFTAVLLLLLLLLLLFTSFRAGAENINTAPPPPAECTQYNCRTRI
jgi:hypothetical protein